MNKKVAIIGGGVSGLSCGYFLVKKGYTVTVYEKEKELGGLLSSFELSDGKKLEKFYHHFFKKDRDFLELLEELRLDDKIVFRRVKTSNFVDKYYSYSNAMDYLFYPRMSFLSKIRMGFGGFYLSLKKAESIKSKTSEKVIKKYLGKEAWVKIWKSLFKKKFPGQYKNISASWFWWRMRTNIFAKGALGYLEGGFTLLTERLRDEIEKRGGAIESDHDSGIDTNNFDFVIDTRPDIEFIDYLGVINVVLEMKNKQTRYYWNNILDKKIPFVGIIEHTNFIKDYQNHILYLTQYVDKNSEWSEKSDSEILEEYKKHFYRLGLKRSDIKAVYVFRAKHAQPIITKDYQKPREKISEKHFSFSMNHVYPEDRGVNQAVRRAKELVDKYF